MIEDKKPAASNQVDRSDITIERIDNLDQLEAFKSDWNRILFENETRTVELTYEWQTTFWKHVGRDSSLFVLIVKQGDRVIGIAPLRLKLSKKFGIPLRQLQFIAADESNFQDFIIAEQHLVVLECIKDYLVQNKALWDVFYLTHVPEESSTVSFLSKQTTSSIQYRLLPPEKCIYANGNKTWAEHTQMRSKKANKKIRQRLNRLEEDGEVKTFYCQNPQELIENLEKFFVLHRNKWNQTTTPSQFNDENYRNFYLEVSPMLLDKGQIDLFVFTLDKEAIGILYTFIYDKQILLQWSSYDTDYEHRSPAIAMRETYLADKFNTQQLSKVDFGIAVPYKEWWGDQFRYRYNMEIYVKNVLPMTVLALDSLKERLKSIEPLRKFVQDIKDKLFIIQKKSMEQDE